MWSAGTSDKPGFHNGRLYLEPENDTQVVQDSTPDEQLVTCSNFKAADPSLATKKSARYDVNGIFGGICLHDVVVGLLDIPEGEKLIYANTLINHLGRQRPDEELLLMYDIACRLSPEKFNVTVDRAVGKMHLYGHKAYCHAKFNPVRKEFFRLADGENAERLWSFLKLFAKISREMTPAGRRDVLVNACLHLNQRAITNADVRLNHRFTKATKELAVAVTDFQETAEIVKAYNGTEITGDLVKKWSTDEENFLAANQKKPASSWKQAYAVDLKVLYVMEARAEDLPLSSLVKEVRDQYENLIESVQNAERIHKIPIRWKEGGEDLEDNYAAAKESKESTLRGKMQQAAVIKRHLQQWQDRANCHKLANKVSKQIITKNHHLRKMATEMSCLTGVELSLDDVSDPDGALYSNLQPLNGVPFLMHRKLIDSYCKKLRCNEEIEALKVEIVSLFGYLKEEYNKVEKVFKNTTASGVSSVLFDKLLEKECLLSKISKLSEKMTPDSPLHFETKHILSLPTRFSDVYTKVTVCDEEIRPAEYADFSDDDDDTPEDDVCDMDYDD